VDALFALVANDQAMFRCARALVRACVSDRASSASRRVARSHYPLPFPSVFTNAAQLRAVYADPMAKGGFHAYVLRRVGDGATVGSCALMDLAPLHRTAELGRIWIGTLTRRLAA
jgi:RimJ/RimL family protein N-acetyltransferase